MNRFRERYNQLLQKPTLTPAEHMILIWCDHKAGEADMLVYKNTNEQVLIPPHELSTREWIAIRFPKEKKC